MTTNYGNWMPDSVIYMSGGIALAGLIIGVYFGFINQSIDATVRLILGIIGALIFLGGLLFLVYCIFARRAFSYTGKRQLSKRIIEGLAAYVNLPEGGKGLDVGCGSGALTIAVAKRNPALRMIGVDSWGTVYDTYGKTLCEKNAAAEGVDNVEFREGNAKQLDFPDGTFDLVCSNYVYHNVFGYNKQALLRETLRVLKPGGTFVLHDLMSKARYGDMEQFRAELKREGYADVRLIPTDDGTLMSEREARLLMLKGSTILIGTK